MKFVWPIDCSTQLSIAFGGIRRTEPQVESKSTSSTIERRPYTWSEPHDITRRPLLKLAITSRRRRHPLLSPAPSALARGRGEQGLGRRGGGAEDGGDAGARKPRRPWRHSRGGHAGGGAAGEPRRARRAGKRRNALSYDRTYENCDVRLHGLHSITIIIVVVVVIIILYIAMRMRDTIRIQFEPMSRYTDIIVAPSRADKPISRHHIGASRADKPINRYHIGASQADNPISRYTYRRVGALVQSEPI